MARTEITPDHYMDLAEDALKAAMDAGAEWCDVSLGRSGDISVDVENGSIKAVEEVTNTGFTVRAFVRGAQGTFSASGFDRDDVLPGAREAAAMAKAAQPDPDFKSLPPPAEGDEVPGLYDDRLRQMTAADAVDIIVKNVEGAREVEPGVVIAGGMTVDASESVLASSTGVRVRRRGTSVQLGFFSIVRRGDDVGSFYEFDMARMLDDFEPLGSGPEATRQALTFLGARKVASRRMSIVLGPLASWGFLRGLAGSTIAENIQRRRSFMVGRQGTKVASPLLNIVDDGLIGRGMFSGRFDGEGAPRRRVTLFENGVFNACLHNSYTANKAGEPNTGHGTQGGGTRPTNLVVALGDRTARQIIADTEEGIYINMGSVSPDPASGDISASVDFGFKIEKGKLAWPVVNTMVGGHIFDFLENLDAVSCDCRQEPGNKLPTLRIRDVQVAGSE
jgi:PmbA protein